MAADKRLIAKTFNNQMTEFVNDLLLILPSDKNVMVLSTFIKTIIMAKPRMMLSIWHTYITQKYEVEILDGNMDYFLNKDYSEDLKDADATSAYEALETIDRLRSSVKKSLDDENNKEKTLKYIQNLIKLTKIYYT